jgi:hypothetical protein
MNASAAEATMPVVCPMSPENDPSGRWRDERNCSAICIDARPSRDISTSPVFAAEQSGPTTKSEAIKKTAEMTRMKNPVK